MSKESKSSNKSTFKSPINALINRFTRGSDQQTGAEYDVDPFVTMEPDSDEPLLAVPPVFSPSALPQDKTNNSKDKHCIPNCNSKSKSMIRCCTCMKWFHTICVNEKSDHEGIWNCFICRNCPNLINKLCFELQLTRRDITKCLSNENDIKEQLLQMQSSLRATQDEVKSLHAVNTDLNDQLQKLSVENQNLKKLLAGKSEDPTPPSNPVSSSPAPISLVIGDSLLRDIKPNNESSLQISCNSGYNLVQVADLLNKLSDENKQFSTIYVIAGTNDCSKTDNSVAHITDNASKVIDAANKVANSIVFASIIPRTDSGSAQLKSENVNLSLKSLCQNKANVTFIDLDGTFRVSDGSINDALLLNDGIHLSYKGSEKLIKYLNIPAIVHRNFRGGLRDRPVNQQNRSQNPYPSRNQYIISPSQYQYTTFPPRNRYSTFPPQNQNRPTTISPLMAPEWKSPHQWYQSALCLTCGSVDHHTKICPRTAHIFCHSCGSRGHRKLHCSS